MNLIIFVNYQNILQNSEMRKTAQEKSLAMRVIICLIASTFYIYDYILRVMPEAMADELMRDFNIGAKGLGILASLFFWGYAPMQIPSGILFDQFSPRKILSLTVFLSAVATLGFTFTHSSVLAAIYRFVMGFVTSFAFVGALVVGAGWFRGKLFAFYTGLVQFLGCMGAIVGITPVAYFTHHFGWRQTSLFIALLGFLLTALTALLVKDAPQRMNHNKEPPLKQIYQEVFRNSQTWWVALFGFAIWAPITIFAALWGVSYLQEAYKISRIAASNQISIIWFTIAIGGPAVGWLSNHFKTRRIPMFLCASLGLLSSLGILFLSKISHFEISLLLICYGLGASALVIAFGLIVDLHPPKAVGAVIGFTNMSIIFAGLTLLPAVGFIIQHLWDGTLINNTIHYSHQNYQMALLVLPSCFALAFITTFFVKETHCRKLHTY